MGEPFSFQQSQLQFTAHLRNPEEEAAPNNIEDRRMAIYRDLIFNNVAGFIESGFPVLYSILDEVRWSSLIRRFLVHHKAQSPYFADVAKEFVTYLEQGDDPLFEEYPFVKELCHYEWVELALMISTDDLAKISVKDSVDLLNETPVLSPTAWPLAYEFDVHHISKEYLPTSAPEQPTFVVVYRDRDDKVSFTEINGVTFALLMLMQENQSMTGLALLEQLAIQLPNVPKEAIIENGLDILMKLMKRDIVLGVQ